MQRVTRVLGKLGAANRTEAAAKAPAARPDPLTPQGIPGCRRLPRHRWCSRLEHRRRLRAVPSPVRQSFDRLRMAHVHNPQHEHRTRTNRPARPADARPAERSGM